VFILGSDTTYLVFIYIVNLIISIAVFYIIVIITIKQFKLLTLKSEKESISAQNVIKLLNVLKEKVRIKP